jgi:hypothetical protein
MVKAPAVSHVYDPATAFDDHAVSDSDFTVAFLAALDESSKVWNGRYCRFSAVAQSYDAQIAVFKALGISGTYCSTSLNIYLYRM